MAAVLSVPEPLLAPLKQLVAAEAIGVEITSGGEATMRIEQDKPKMESDLSTLRAGGWITCPVARAGASKLEISNRAMGKILDLLKIKVRRCDLGCFQ